MIVGFLGAELARWDQLLRERGGRPGCLGLPFFEDERPLRGAAGLCDWRLGGRISRLLGSDGASRVAGAYGEKVLLPTGARLPFSRLVLFGLGPAIAFDEDVARRAGRELLQSLAGLVEGPGDVEALPIALVPPGRSTGALSARRALELLLEEAATILPAQARLTIVESMAGQKEAAELARRHAGGDVGPSAAL